MAVKTQRAVRARQFPTLSIPTPQIRKWALALTWTPTRLGRLGTHSFLSDSELRLSAHSSARHHVSTSVVHDARLGIHTAYEGLRAEAT